MRATTMEIDRQFLESLSSQLLQGLESFRSEVRAELRALRTSQDETNAELVKTNARLDQMNADFKQTNRCLDELHGACTATKDGWQGTMFAMKLLNARLSHFQTEFGFRLSTLEWFLRSYLEGGHRNGRE